MAFHLVDIKINGIKTFKDNEFYLNFRNERRVFDFELDEKVLSPLSGRNYRNHIIAIAGINASGKTSVLNILQLIFNVFWQGAPLNQAKNLPVFVPDATLLLDAPVFIQCHFLNHRQLFRLTATIKYDDRRQTYFFEDEQLRVKELKSRENKADFLNFKKTSDKQVQRRREISQDSLKFLKEDVSMIPGLLDMLHHDPYEFIQSTLTQTNLNLVPEIPQTDLLPEILQYLDPSIEKFTVQNPEAPYDTRVYQLKFYQQPPLQVEYINLGHYLSSGTLKGLDLYGRALKVLHNGGYLLVDEIENHFNKILVEKFINLFQSEANINGATLVFSTHYAEILDNILRMDAIKVLRKSEVGITLDSLAALAKATGKDRKDIKNSDLILSGIFDTAPSYEDYWALHKEIIAEVRESEVAG